MPISHAHPLDRSRPARRRRPARAAAVILAFAAAAGCESPLRSVDRRVDALIDQTTAAIGEEIRAEYAQAGETGGPRLPSYDRSTDRAAEHPPTENPPAEDVPFRAAGEADADTVLERLRGYSAVPADALRFDLRAALTYAMQFSREYRFAEEEYVLAALRLLQERHRWGPRFFDEVSATVAGRGDEGLFDTSLRLVNELRATQRLPYGGEISARALASATEDLHRRVAGEEVQSADIILGANVPLLRGAGLTAREDLIQRERDLIYAARGFGRFRRQFLFDVARDFLNLVVLLQRIENARISVESFRQVEGQQKALYQAGRSTPFDAAEATNQTLEAEDNLNAASENYRLALDRFKVRVGMAIVEGLEIDPYTLDVPTPRVGMDEAVYTAMSFRLDLQTQRDRLGDAARNVDNARNGLLGDLDLSASVQIPTDDDIARAGLQFEPGDTDFTVGVTYGLPLDREIERLAVRQRQIDLARSQRAYDQFRDDVAIGVRAAVRSIDRARFSLEIQEQNVAIAEQRKASIDAAPDRADIRQKTTAISQVTSARDNRDSARRDLEVAVLRYLLETGQLRVGPDGAVKPLEGMTLPPRRPLPGAD